MADEFHSDDGVHAIDEAFQPQNPSPPGRASAFFLFWCGVGIALLGIALPLSGYASGFVSLPEWGVSEWMARVGIENGELIVGGLILLAMGLVVRSTVKAARFRPAGGGLAAGSASDSDFMLVADQLATDLAQVLSSTLQISEELAGIGESQRAFFQSQESGDEPSDQQHNALFRLAASLDKLNAHVDERIHGLDVQVRSHFEGIANAVYETKATIEARLGGGAAPAAAPPAPAPAAAMGAFDGQGVEDDVHVVDISDEEVYGAMERIEAGQAPDPNLYPDPGAQQPPFPQGGTDSLDALLPDDSIHRAIEGDHFPPPQI